MDWKLTVFRLGLLTCIVGALLMATRYDVIGTMAALWNHDPTNQEITAADTAYANKQAACLASVAKATEYPRHCYVSSPTFSGIAGDVAVANLRGIVVSSAALFVLLFAVLALGIHMAREGPLSPEGMPR